MTSVSRGDITAQVTEYADELRASEASSASVIEKMTAFAAHTIPGVEHAGITLLTHKTIETPAATGPIPVVVDDIQRKCNEGPSLSAAVGEIYIDVDDLAGTVRWPNFRSEVLAHTPVRSVLAFQLHSGTHIRAALTIYAEHPHAFDLTARETGLLVATHLGFAWDGKRREEQFLQALASRDVIGQAKGMIMERYDKTADEAFEMLRTLSQDTNISVASIAQRLVNRDHPNPCAGNRHT